MNGYMRFIEKLLGRRIKSKGKKSYHLEDQRGKFMPPPETPVDDKFILNFKENGGKFLYCSNEDDLASTFREILKENKWHDEACCFDTKLKDKFSQFNLNFSRNLEAPFCLLSCEFLIANIGALLMSSNQIGEKSLKELPDNFVVFAGTTQIVDKLDEGLRRINLRKEDIPTNITTIKSFQKLPDDEGHFLSYGRTSKNLYLLLLEDF